VSSHFLFLILYGCGYSARIYDPESIKDIIAKQQWSEGRKDNAADAYSSFLQMTGGKWQRPKYKGAHKPPIHPSRKRSRPTNRSVQHTHGNIPPTPQRNKSTLRRSMELNMARRRHDNQNRKNHPRKRQQPKNIPPQRKISRNV